MAHTIQISSDYWDQHEAVKKGWAFKNEENDLMIRSSPTSFGRLNYGNVLF